MATTTTNYGLTKPSYGDNADIAVINSNMDKIDAKMKEIEDAGGGGASTWAEVENKPFETVGSGLSVDESGALNATGGGSGGSSVEWNQIQTSGTKIAEVTIDGKKTDVYAPTGGSGGGGESLYNYSEEEHIVGTWIDGSPVYEAIYTFSAANDMQWHRFDLGNIRLISFEPFPEIATCVTESGQYMRFYSCNPNYFMVKVSSRFSAIVNGKVIIRYIKTE